MKTGPRPLGRVETWLLEGKMMRRVASKERVPVKQFEEQRRPDTRYIILKHVLGSYSDSKGDSRTPFERVE